MNIPNDPIILLSYINTQLRDNFKNLDDLCSYLNIPSHEISEKLKAIGYSYDEKFNRFK